MLYILWYGFSGVGMDIVRRLIMNAVDRGLLVITAIVILVGLVMVDHNLRPVMVAVVTLGIARYAHLAIQETEEEVNEARNLEFVYRVNQFLKLNDAMGGLGYEIQATMLYLVQKLECKEDNSILTEIEWGIKDLAIQTQSRINRVGVCNSLEFKEGVEVLLETIRILSGSLNTYRTDPRYTSMSKEEILALYKDRFVQKKKKT